MFSTFPSFIPSHQVNRKTAVVRYMFFNREDVQWFKPVELRTKWGRRGHIKEPLGGLTKEKGYCFIL